MTNIEQTLAEIKDQIAKAAVTNATYTQSPATRSIFAPENLDPVIKIIPPTAAPVRAFMPRSKGFGQAAAWKRLTSQLVSGNRGTGTITGSSTNGTGYDASFTDAGQPNTSSVQVFDTVTAAYKNLGVDVEVGRQAIASARGYQDMRDELVRIKTLELMVDEEWMILNGDSTNNTSNFDGFAKAFTTNSGTATLLTASGISSSLMSMYWTYPANIQKLVCNPRQIRGLADDLSSSGSIQRIMVDDRGAATGGVALSKVVNAIDGSLIDVVMSRYTGSYAYFLTVTLPSGENALEMEDLEPMSVYEPATANHSVISRIYETTVLKVIYEPYQLKLSNLATA